MEHTELIATLTAAFAAALILGYLTERLRLSPIVGYLIGGIVIGPHTPGFIADHGIAEQLAEIGVILLMFGVGLHFHLRELIAVRRVAVPAATMQSAFVTAIGALLGYWAGWGAGAGALFGFAVSVSSTVVVTRVLGENRALLTQPGRISIGWLVVEDILCVVALVLLPELVGRSTDALAVSMSVLLSLLKVTALIAIVLPLGGRVIPWLLERAATTSSRELFTLSILVVALGIAVGSAMIFGVSLALGAFLAGMVVGRSEFSLRAASEALPMRDAFAVLFFVSFGMLLDPSVLINAPVEAFVTVLLILLVKPITGFWAVAVAGYPRDTAIRVGLLRSQIGEFSFILVTSGRHLGVLSPEAVQCTVVAAILSIALTPLIFRLAAPVGRWICRRPRLDRWFAARTLHADNRGEDSEDPAIVPAHRAVVVGYGPVGRTVTRLLRENGIEPVVVDLNLDLVRTARENGIHAVYGDSVQLATLEEAGLRSASSIILTSAGMIGVREVVRQARELNPDVRILARSAYVAELRELRAAGADRVFSGEGEIALALTTEILRAFGATPEQIDHERDRVRAELLGRPMPAPIQTLVPAQADEEAA